MSGQNLHTCERCDARSLSSFSPARGVRLAVCAYCATESRRDGVDLETVVEPALLDRDRERKR